MYKIKTELFSLICNIFYIHLLLCGMGFVNGIQRKKIRPRHAVKFSMPCACRGVKKFCVFDFLFLGNFPYICANKH